MAVLLVGAAGAVADAIVSRLLNQGDEVRIVARSPEETGRWRDLGAHIARGDPEDPDLIERAAQNARSIVTFDNHAGSNDVLEAAIEGGMGAQVSRLIVCCTGVPGRWTRDRVSRAALEHILLITGANRRGSSVLLRTRKVTTADVARAVDAADDLAGHPRVVLDLRRPEAWRALELEPPG
jgi:uncharacterized protein YbjT (DUF2867 family)